MRYKSQINTDEELLLAEIEKFASWMLSEKKFMTIYLSPKQMVIFKRLCGRLREHDSLIDRQQLIRHIDTHNISFRGFKIAAEKSGKKYTKKDMMELPL